MSFVFGFGFDPELFSAPSEGMSVALDGCLGRAVGLPAGFPAGFAAGFAAGFSAGFVAGTVAGFAVGLATDLAFAFVLGLVTGLGFTVDLDPVVVDDAVFFDEPTGDVFMLATASFPDGAGTEAGARRAFRTGLVVGVQKANPSIAVVRATIESPDFTGANSWPLTSLFPKEISSNRDIFAAA